MRKIFFAAIFLLVFFVWVQYVAAAPVDQIVERIADLQRRIDDGKISGELIPPEAKKLQIRLDGIRRHFERVRRGGPLPPPEVDRINHRLNVLEKDIVKHKHDPQKR